MSPREATSVWCLGQRRASDRTLATDARSQPCRWRTTQVNLRHPRRRAPPKWLPTQKGQLRPRSCSAEEQVEHFGRRPCSAISLRPTMALRSAGCPGSGRQRRSCPSCANSGLAVLTAENLRHLVRPCPLWIILSPHLPVVGCGIPVLGTHSPPGRLHSVALWVVVTTSPASAYV